MFPSRHATLGGDVFRDEYSLSFDGTNDYVDLGTKATSGDDATVSAWIYTEDTNVNDILRYGDMAVRVQDDTSIWVYPDGAGAANDITVPSVLNSWVHICVVIDSNAVTVYHNGVSKGTASDGGTLSTDSMASYIGRFGSAYFNGKISEVVLYSSTLSASQVKTIYNGREPYNHKEGVASGNLQGWWRRGDGLENHSGSTIYDMSINSNNGTMTNMASDDFTGDTP